MCGCWLTPWPTLCNGNFNSSTLQHDSISISHQFDSISISYCSQVASAVPLSAWFDIYIASWPSRLDGTIINRTWGSAHTFLTSNPTQMFIADQPLGLEEYYSNRRPDLDTLLPSLRTSTWGECVVTTMIWNTSSNQLSPFLSCILFWVNISIYF
jgi:hypothetical protein